MLSLCCYKTRSLSGGGSGDKGIHLDDNYNFEKEKKRIK
jgi:hypothetical protein